VSKDLIKTAVVGVGYLGKFHAEKFAKSKKAELVAIVDSDEASRNKWAKKYRAKAVSDFRQLPDLGIQCASVVTNTSAHHEIASFLLQNGIDVLVEKPMTVTTNEARHLIELSKKHNRILQVGHLERFNPAFRALKSVLYRPWFFEVRRIAPFKARATDVDVVLDLMIHDIDIVAHLVGEPVVHIEAVGVPVLTKTIDIASARLTFRGGAIANVTASRAALTSERTIRIFQPNLYISLDFEKKKLKIYQKSKDIDSKGFPKISVNEHSVKERDALEHEIDSFINCVIGRNEPEVRGEDGLRALELTERIHKAFADSFSRMSKENQTIYLAEGEGRL
jgi:predicted dehydrogenase